MRKALAMLMLAAMMLSAGCGENTIEGLKKDSQEASQKIEQATSDANVKLKEANEKLMAMKSNADKKWIEMRDDVRDQLHSKAMELSGVKPGMTVEEAKEVLGEPVKAEDDKLVFDNGVELEIDKDGNRVEELKVNQEGDTNAAGVKVGMPENSLKDMCGPADDIELNDNGDFEYIYYSTDKKSKVVYKARNDIIIEIKSSLND